MRHILKWILGLVFLGLIIVWSFGVYMFEFKGTDVAFQSSDGRWADYEVLFKGRDFDSIVLYFELYKLKCGVREVDLQRITKKPNALTISWWLDDFEHPKWKITLVDHHPNLNGEYYVQPACSASPTSQITLDMADENRKKNLQALRDS